MLTSRAKLAFTFTLVIWTNHAFGQAESDYPLHCKEALQDWQPYPDDADFMVVTTHPDDEGIFFGGTLPYYTQVRQKSTILIGMTGSESNHAGYNRREELERAAWHYGVRHQPINFGYSDTNSNVANEWEPVEGKYGVVKRLATEIRRYKPDVLLTHDFNGEYGHEAHQVTASALTEAYDVAADPLVDLEGLAPWQAQKIYIHLYNSPGGSAAVPSPTVSPNGYMYHSWEETFAELGGKSSREIANEALLCHQDAIAVWPDLEVSTRAKTGETVFDGFHSEDWGLFATEVGPDTVDSDFFQNVTSDFFFPAVFGDLNDSQSLTVDDWLVFKANAGESLATLSREARYLRGDLDFDGDNDIEDFRIFRALFNAEHGPNVFGELAHIVPEPTGLLLTSGVVSILVMRRFVGGRSLN